MNNESQVPELNNADSNVLACHLQILLAGLKLIDWDYFEACMLALSQKAPQYDARAALNVFWTPEHSQVLELEYKAMRLLWNYRQTLQEIDKAKQADAANRLKRAMINKLLQ